MIKKLLFCCFGVFLISSVHAKDIQYENFLGSYLSITEDGLTDYGLNGELSLKIKGKVFFDVLFSKYNVLDRDVETRSVNIGLTSDPLKDHAISAAYSYWGRNRTIETESLLLAYSRWFNRWGFDIKPLYRNLDIYIPRIVNSTLVFLEFDIQNYGIGGELKRLGKKWHHAWSANYFYYSEDMTRLDVSRLSLPPLSQTNRVQRYALFSALSGYSLGGSLEDYNVSYRFSRSGKKITSGLEIIRNRSAIDKTVADLVNLNISMSFKKRHRLSFDWLQNLDSSQLWSGRIGYTIEF